MKKQISLLCLFTVIYIAVACQSTQEGERTNDETIIIPVKNLSTDSVIKASVYFKTATVVPLETSPDCLLSELEKAIPYKGILYVLDRYNKSGVFCFDMTGKLVGKIGSLGAGPQNHASLYDFSIEEESELIYLNDRDRQRILVFTLEGDYVKAIPCPGYFTRAEVFDQRLLLARNGCRSDTYDLEIWDLSGKRLVQYFPAPEGKIPPLPRLIKTGREVYYYPNRSQDTVYTLSQGMPSIAFYADYGKHAISRREWEKATDVVYESNHPFWQTLLQNDYIGGFSSVCIFDKLIVFEFVYQMNGNWKVFYERSTDKTSVVFSFIDDLSYVGFNYLVSQTDTQMIGAVQPDFEKVIESIRTCWIDRQYVTPEEAAAGIALLKSLQSRLTEESNPIVVIYELK